MSSISGTKAFKIKKYNEIFNTIYY